MSRFLDLIDQAFRILPKRFGGTANDSGHGVSVVNGFTAKSSIPLYSPVYVSQEFDRVTTSTTVGDVRIIGVLVGKYAQLAGEPEPVFQRSAPSNAELAAIMQLGRTPVRVFGSVTRDQYALQSGTAGLALGSNLTTGAFGRFLAAGSNTVSAYIFPTSLGGSGGTSGAGGISPEYVSVSANDTTPGYLGQKLVSGIGINIAEQNDGSNESLVVSALGSNTMYNPQRLVYWDDCTETSLPVGASSTGQLTYDGTRLRRVLGGTSASTYTVPTQILNGPLILEVIHENIANLASGDFLVDMILPAGPTTVATAAFQTDGNLVGYIDLGTKAGTARTNSGPSVDVTGNLHRSVITVDEQKRVGVTIMDAGYGSLEGAVSSGETGEAGARYTYTGTLNAGDGVQFKLSTTSTRSIALYGVRVYRGAFAAPLGNTLALSSNTPASIVSGTAAIGTGSTAARSDHTHAASYASFARFFD